jgi:hypothetical protein
MFAGELLLNYNIDLAATPGVRFGSVASSPTKEIRCVLSVSVTHLISFARRKSTLGTQHGIDI